jgi:adenylate cyclase
MFTDTVGYTASTQADESHALDLLREQVELVRPLLTLHAGREIKSTGDGFLVEFDSALKAVRCAMSVQRKIHERNAEPGRFPFQVRIGIHLGDIEERGSDILGDAVNIAARVEPVAEPGGICVSAAVRDQVWNKIPERLERLSPRMLKGLKEGTDLYRILLPWSPPAPALAPAAPAGLAILPLANISPDPSDEYFADGLTEEVITALSQLRSLRVIARTSVVSYKSSSKGIAQIGAELGVATILEGSVRKAGNRLRVTFQLIDVKTEGHIWAQTYDRELDDIFAIQSELARQVVDVLRVELGTSEAARLEKRPVIRSDSYLAYLRGRTLLYSPSRPALLAAREHFQQAIELDPKNAAAYSGMADVSRMMGWWRMEPTGGSWDDASRRWAVQALDLDPSLAEAHTSLAISLWTLYDVVGAEKQFRWAIALNPSYPVAHHWYAELLENLGRVDEALVEFRLAEAADPLSPFNLAHFADLLIMTRRLEEALARIQKLGEVAPEDANYFASMAEYHLARGEIEPALKAFARGEELEPDPVQKALWRLSYLTAAGEIGPAKVLLAREDVAAEMARSQMTMARTWADLGDLDACFEWMERSLEAHTFVIQLFRLDPRYGRVRNDPRFVVLLRKANLA